AWLASTSGRRQSRASKAREARRWRRRRPPRQRYRNFNRQRVLLRSALREKTVRQQMVPIDAGFRAVGTTGFGLDDGDHARLVELSVLEDRRRSGRARRIGTRS